MKMISRILTEIDGAETYAIIAMLIFFAMFIMVGIWLLWVRKGYFNEVSQLPLEEDDLEMNQSETSNH